MVSWNACDFLDLRTFFSVTSFVFTVNPVGTENLNLQVDRFCKPAQVSERVLCAQCARRTYDSNCARRIFIFMMTVLRDQVNGY